MADTCVAPSKLHLKKELTTLRKAHFLRDPETCSSWRSPLNSFAAASTVNHGNDIGNNEKLFQSSSSGNRKKRVYLYNWKNHSRNSSESGLKLENEVKKSRNTKQKKHIRKRVPVVDSVDQSEDTDYCNSDDLQKLAQELIQKAAHRSASASPLFSGSGCGNWSYSSKLFRGSRREGSSHSHTPASTSSYYRAAASVDEDELDQLDLQRNQRSGVTRLRRNKDYSPSLSDTLRRKGTSLLCGSQTMYNKKKKYVSKNSQGLPLLRNSCDDDNSSLCSPNDELSTNFGELELEALSRLDGRRWSSCKSQEGFDDMDVTYGRSLSFKYRARSFDEIIGQNIVTNSLASAIRRGKLAPAYLFQGPRGTGKSTTARIFATALNCLSSEDAKPCLFCSECNDGTNVTEVDAVNKKGIERVKHLLKNTHAVTPSSRYKVFIIDECHLLSSRVWSAFLNFLQEPSPRVVFIFITIDPENLPRAVVSRCQKFHFSKIKDVDIVCQLRKLSSEENIDVDLDALDSIALISDGSLRDAVTMLEQLSLLGKRITTSLVNELAGVVSDEKLLDLLEIAMSSNTAETVKRSRELMDSGVDPVALMSQLAGLIMDIIAGSNQMVDSQSNGVVHDGQSLSENELKRLQQSLNILSDAEKQLRLSSERSTWFTAALLQLGSGRNSDFSLSSSSSKLSSRSSAVAIDVAKDTSFLLREAGTGYPSPNLAKSEKLSEISVSNMSPTRLAMVWGRCIQRCHSETLRELLGSHGKLVSIAEIEGALVAFIVFEDENIKSRAERYVSSITNSMEIVLQHNVDIRIGLASEYIMKYAPKNHSRDSVSNSVKLPEKARYKGLLNLPRSVDSSESSVHQNQEISVLKKYTASIDEHRLENAWLQAAGKTSSASTAHSISQRNLVHPQNGVSIESHNKASSKHWEDGINLSIKALKDGDVHSKGQVEQYGISPSLLHAGDIVAEIDKQNIKYKRGHGCTGLFCWQSQKPPKVTTQVKQGIRVQSPKTGRFHCLSSMRSRKSEKSKATA